MLENKSDWTMIGAILGGLGVLLMVLIIGLYCRFVRRRPGFNKALFAANLKNSGVKVLCC